jgi:glycosyltransferase involved in cell wall biosynthesis
LRVLILVHGLPVGGTETMACLLARGLRARGVEVAVGCLDEIGELGHGLAGDGFSVRCYGRRPGFDAGLPLRIAAHARRLGAQVVHAHQYTCFFYGVLAKPLARAGLVFTEHGRGYPDPPRPKRRLFNRVFARFADRITAVSQGVRESLRVVEGFDAGSIEIVYNGIELARYAAVSRLEARRRLGLAEDAPAVGTIGRLDPIKNYPLLLEAFRRLLPRLPRASLLFVGDGPERARLEQLARGLGLDGRVRFLGRRFDVDAILPGFDVFALSSFSEGLPMTLIEAMAARVAVLSVAVGGIAEMVRDGQDALLLSGVPPELHTPEQLAAGEYPARYSEALARLLEDAALRERLSSSALERARRLFSLDAICERYIRLYGEVGR